MRQISNQNLNNACSQMGTPTITLDVLGFLRYDSSIK